jgi:hypothetical protein
MSTTLAVGTRVEIARDEVLNYVGTKLYNTLSASSPVLGTIGTKAKDKRKWPVTLDDVPQKIIHVRSAHMTVLAFPVALVTGAAAAAAAASPSPALGSGAAAASSATTQGASAEEVMDPALARILLEQMIEIAPPDEMSERAQITLKMEDPEAEPRLWSATTGKYRGIEWTRNRASGVAVPVFRNTARAPTTRAAARMGVAGVSQFERGPKGLPRGVDVDCEPVEFFNLYNTPEFRRDVVLRESRRYAKQTGMGVTRYGRTSHNIYTPLQLADIDNSFACLLYNGVKPSPRFRSNWYGHLGLRNSSMCAAQTFPRWQHFWSAFHLADNEAARGDRKDRHYDHLWKISPALDHFREACGKYWEPGEYGSIDETTRRIGAHCNPLIKTNCSKYKDEGDGIQFESYADGTYLVDFLWRHDPRFRRSAKKGLESQSPEITGALGSALESETSRRVLRLLYRVNQMSPWRGRHVYVDNLYSDYGLFVAARDEYGTKMTGTCRAQRGGRPKHIVQERYDGSSSDVRKKKKGTTLWSTTADGVLAASIYDTVPVYFMSTGYDRPECFYKDRGHFMNPLPKFRLQDDFNNRMNFVDRFDGRVGCYRTDRIVSSKWWISPGLWALLDGPSANAYTLYDALCERNEVKKMARLDFQLKIADGLVQEAAESRKHRGSPSPAAKRPRTDSGDDERSGGRRKRGGQARVIKGGCTRRLGKIHSNRCQRCRLTGGTTYTNMQCIDCNLALCVECFNSHSP